MPLPRPALDALRDYESRLADVRRAHRQLVAARGVARSAAEAAHDAALRRAREAAERVRTLAGA